MLCFLICVISCVIDYGSAVFVLNKSDHTIYVYKTFQDSLSMNDGLLLKQSSYKNNEVDTMIYPSYRARPDSLAVLTFRGKRNEIFKSSYNVDGKLRIFIINESIISKYTWKQICDKQIYEKKLLITEEDLKKNNWTVIYR